MKIRVELEIDEDIYMRLKLIAIKKFKEVTDTEIKFYEKESNIIGIKVTGALVRGEFHIIEE